MLEPELQGNWSLVLAYRQAPKNDTGRLLRGEKLRLMTEFDKTRKQVSRIIRLVISADKKGICLDLSDKRKLLAGAPSRLTPEIRNAMKAINKSNLNKKIRTTRRRMRAGLKKKGIVLSLGTVHRYILLLKGKLATWHVKFLLTQEQRENRLQYVNDQIIPGTEEFRSIENDVHVDEKWFYLIMERGRFLMFPEDELPVFYTQHKNSILKVMFLCAVCKPQRRPDGSLMNGLIACEAFTDTTEAQRSSSNRPKGTLVEKPISVTARVYREYMQTRVYPKIRERLHWKKHEKIIIRQDGAKPHNGDGNKAFFARHGQLYGWNIEVDTQCAQSPDVNILDIGV